MLIKEPLTWIAPSTSPNKFFTGRNWLWHVLSEIVVKYLRFLTNNAWVPFSQFFFSMFQYKNGHQLQFTVKITNNSATIGTLTTGQFFHLWKCPFISLYVSISNCGSRPPALSNIKQLRGYSYRITCKVRFGSSFDLLYVIYLSKHFNLIIYVFVVGAQNKIHIISILWWLCMYTGCIKNGP